MKRLLATGCALTALAISGCGEEDSAGSGAELAGLAPADAVVYAEAVVRPEGQQREQIEAALGTLLSTDDPGGLIVDQLEQEDEEEGTEFSFSEDVLDWLGERASVFVSDFAPGGGTYAVVIETTDAEAAAETNRAAIEADGESFTEESYGGVDYLLESGDEETGEQEAFPASGIVDSHLVGGSQEGFKAVVDAAAGESLADSTELPDEFDQLGSDVAAAFYADPASVLDALEAAGELPADQREAVETALGIGIDDPVAGSLGATSSSFFLELSSAPGDTTAEAAPDLLAELPASSWLALSAGEAGTAIDAAIAGFDAQLEAAPVVPPQLRGGLEAAAARELGLELSELTSWIGDVAFYFRGTSIFGLGGALIVETSDEVATLEALERLREALEREPGVGIQPLNIEGQGFEVVVVGAPVQIPVVLRDGRLVAGLGTESVEESFEPDEPLSDSDGFTAAAEALGDDLEPSFFFDFEPLVELVESTGQTPGPDYAEAKPYLEALDFLVFGHSLEDGRAAFRVTFGVDEAAE